MADLDLAFVLIPLVPALSFMVWVIWGLEKQIRQERRHRDATLALRARSSGPRN